MKGLTPTPDPLEELKALTRASRADIEGPRFWAKLDTVIAAWEKERASPDAAWQETYAERRTLATLRAEVEKVEGELREWRDGDDIMYSDLMELADRLKKALGGNP